MQVWASTALKGGTGKSTVVVNLAMSLANKGKKILLVDVDFAANNLDLMLNFDSTYDIRHFISGEKKLEELIVKKNDYIDVISGNSGTPETANLSDEIIDKIVKNINIIKHRYDIVLIDTPPTLHNSCLKFCMMSDFLIMIPNTDSISLMDIFQMLKVLIAKGFISTNIGILVNKTPNPRSGEITFDTLNNASKKYLSKELTYLGCVEQSKAFENAIRKKTQVYNEYPNFRRVFDSIVDKILK